MAEKIRTHEMSAKLKRRALIVLATVVPALSAAIALPRLVDVDEGLLDPVLLSDAVTGARASADAANTDASGSDEFEEPIAKAPELGPHAGGDLRLALGMRRTSYPAGAIVRARLTLLNHSLDTVHVPAPGEPQPTLRIVILDAAGETVRTIVEDADDPMPRRTCRLASGGQIEWDVDVVAAGEAPLEPGTYRLAAVYDASPAWQRTGLDMWTAPGGSVRADQFSFEITSTDR